MTDMMKAIGIRRYGGPEVVEILDWPKPSPGPREVLVRVLATGVNPLDWKARDGVVSEFLPHGPPFVLGADVSGVVEAVGEGVTRHKVGDEVFGQVGLLGGYAQYAVTSENRLAQKPAGLSHAEAAATPISAMTAYQSLFDDGGLQAGERVLIHAGSGGVGSFAVQMARNAGAHVITTTSQANADFVRSLGADEAIDYRSRPFEEVVEPVDLVVDTQYGEILDRSWSVLKPSGRMMSTVGPPDPAKAAALGARTKFVIGAPDEHGQRLDRIAALIDEGVVKPQLQQVFPFERVADALELSKSGHVRGKLAVTIEG